MNIYDDNTYVINLDLLKHIISVCDVLLDNEKSEKIHVGKLAKINIDDNKRKFYVKIVEK
jgi:hypothetical protein